MERERESILEDAAKRMPMLLIGGYLIDEAIIALYRALRLDGPSQVEQNNDFLTEEEIWTRIVDAMGAAYAGLI